MSTPNYQGVYELIKKKLYDNLAPHLYYHGANHTFLDVIPAAEKLSQWENVNEEDTLIIKTGKYTRKFLNLEVYE